VPTENAAISKSPDGDPLDRDRKGCPGVMIVLFGIMLPAIALLLEMHSGVFSGFGFELLPTWLNVFLVALVPVAHVYGLVIRNTDKTTGIRIAFCLASIVTGVSLFYALQMIVTIPLAFLLALTLIGLVIAFPLMAPHLSLIFSICLMQDLRRRCLRLCPGRRLLAWPGILAGFGLLIMAEMPVWLTNYWMYQMANASNAIRAQALYWLRTAGDRDQMLRVCHRQSMANDSFLNGLFNSMLSPFNATPEHAQAIFFRVTGTPYNSWETPSKRRFDSHQKPEQFQWWDAGHGGDLVANRVSGLSLAGSSMLGRIEMAGGLSYTEWTMEFRNDSWVPAEARMQIALPPDGVVSRVTLWVNGEEREAAFAASSKVREAYQAIVSQDKDPLLVTASGRNQVMLQCFPVPARTNRDEVDKPGMMKVRIGVTSPLVLGEKGVASLILPRIRESNFDYHESIKPVFRFNSEIPFSPDQFLHEDVKVEFADDRRMVHGKWNPQGLGMHCKLDVLQGQIPLASWAEDHRGNAGFIRQEIIREPVEKAGALSIIIDGSRTMSEWRAEVAALLGLLDVDVPLRVLVATDGGYLDVTDDPVEKLSKFNFNGGRNNIPALQAGLDFVGEHERGAVLWIHAFQPIADADLDVLVDRLGRNPADSRVMHYMFGHGSDVVSQAARDLEVWTEIINTGNPLEDFRGVIDSLKQDSRLVFRRSPSTRLPVGMNATDHIIRLWVRDEVDAAIRSEVRMSDAEERTRNLAVQWTLVTQLSGAVVLETQAQYEEAGLTPIDPNSAPLVVPEPSSVMLLLLGGFLLRLFKVFKGIQGVFKGHRNSVRNSVIISSGKSGSIRNYDEARLGERSERLNLLKTIWLRRGSLERAALLQ